MGKMLEMLTQDTDKYLKNLTDDEILQLREEIENNISNMIMKIKRDDETITDENIATHIGVSRSRVTQLKNKVDVPTDSLLIIIRLALYANCSVDELLCGFKFTEREKELNKNVLTEKSIQILKDSTPKKVKKLWKSNLPDNIPSYDRLVNYLICKNSTICESSNNGYIGNINYNMLYNTFEKIENIIYELKRIAYKNDLTKLSYNELKSKLPNKLTKQINELPEIFINYIEDEYNRKVDSIIGIVDENQN